MEIRKTKCKKCLYKNNKGSQEPCNRCNEIQSKPYDFENNFIPADKNLMMEVPHEYN